MQILAAAWILSCYRLFTLCSIVSAIAFRSYFGEAIYFTKTQLNKFRQGTLIYEINLDVVSLGKRQKHNIY